MGKIYNNWKGTIIYENKQSLLSNRKNLVVTLRNKNEQKKFEVIQKLIRNNLKTRLLCTLLKAMRMLTLE